MIASNSSLSVSVSVSVSVTVSVSVSVSKTCYLYIALFLPTIISILPAFDTRPVTVGVGGLRRTDASSGS